MTVRIAEIATIDASLRLLLAPQLEALRKAGYDVTAISAPGPDAAAIEATGARFLGVPMTRRVTPLRDARSLVSLARVLRREKFDVINTHTPKAGLIGPLAGRLARVPLIVHTVHGLMFHDEMPRTQRKAFELAERFTALWSHYLFFQSEEDVATAKRLKLKRADRIIHVGNGIDVTRFSPAAATQDRSAVRADLGYGEQDYVVGIVARLVHEKGVHELFDAVRILMGRIPNLRLLVVGPVEPDQSDAITKTDIDAMKTTGCASFLGFRQDTRELYLAMDCFVLPSHREGIPRAAMEASAMGIPVIATDTRGCREVVVHEETGLLVPVRDPQALANAIERYHGDRQFAARMAESGQKRISERFDQRAVSERVVRALAKACGERGLA